MNETMTNCPQCGRHCSLTMPACERGRRYAAQIAAGETPEGPEKREGHHGHGPHHQMDMNSLQGLFRACGHQLHHGGEQAEVLFDRLTAEEKETMKALLRKMLTTEEGE